MLLSSSGVARNFSRGGFANFLYGKILGGGIYFQTFFLKNPSKLKNFWAKGGTNPPIPPSGYAHAIKKN